MIGNAICIYLTLVLFPHVGFLCYALIVIALALVLIFYFVPRYGQTHILVYVGVCSLVGSLTVNFYNKRYMLSIWFIDFDIVSIFIGFSGLFFLQVMSVRALGIALKLTFSGVNQLVYLQTWVFAVIVAACVVTQINYLNKVTFLSLNFFGQCDCMIIIFVSLFISRHLTPSTQQLYRLYTMLCSHHLPFWQVLLCSRYNPFLLLLYYFSI